MTINLTYPKEWVFDESLLPTDNHERTVSLITILSKIVFY